jgi:hypothetical protein
MKTEEPVVTTFLTHVFVLVLAEVIVNLIRIAVGL